MTMADFNYYTIAAVTLCIGLIYVKFFRAKYCQSKVQLTGKTVIITGGNAGIGKEAAVELARRGARVILACRNPSKASIAVCEVRERSGNQNVSFRQLDMANPDSIRNFVETFLDEESRLDILVNNAGISYGNPGVTVEGYDLIMWVNHLAPFLLTNLLIDRLKKCAPSRIVTVSSSAHSGISTIEDCFYLRRKTAPPKTRVIPMYGQTKLMNISFMRELDKRLFRCGVTTYSLHPGLVHTNIFQSNVGNAEGIGMKLFFILSYVLMWPFMISPKAGAQTTVFCAIDDSISHLSGRYFTNCQLGRESDLARHNGLGKTVWDVSMRATGLQK